jgi:hypothetical protein
MEAMEIAEALQAASLGLNTLVLICDSAQS